MNIPSRSSSQACRLVEFHTTGRFEPAQVFAPHLSATQMDLPSDRFSTAARRPRFDLQASSPKPSIVDRGWQIMTVVSCSGCMRVRETATIANTTRFHSTGGGTWGLLSLKKNVRDKRIARVEAPRNLWLLTPREGYSPAQDPSLLLTRRNLSRVPPRINRSYRSIGLIGLIGPIVPIDDY